MGESFYVNSVDEMCAMMCDNHVPKEKPKWWYFTFGYGQKNAGFYVKIHGTFSQARRKMLDKYGTKWGFQYSEREWELWANRCPKGILEKELEVRD